MLMKTSAVSILACLSLLRVLVRLARQIGAAIGRIRLARYDLRALDAGKGAALLEGLLPRVQEGNLATKDRLDSFKVWIGSGTDFDIFSG